ncbi:MAG TPA: hypothetical protein ENJ84_04790 [Gammaproteobacteria bacterium]|nr:hypothetical protein [Gammaproteobacteria bacterium]
MSTEQQQAARKELTQGLMTMMEGWGLSLDDIRTVLAIPVPVRKMDKFRRSEAFPDEEEVNKRIEHIVGIAEGLNTAHPTNNRMVIHWLKQPNRKFNKRPPLESIVKDGLAGIVKVRAEVDCTFAWIENSAY